MGDQRTVLAVIVFLGLVALTTVVGGIFLAKDGHDIPEALVAIGSAAAGSLGTILSRPTQEVRVSNPPDDPIPVDPTGH